MSEIEKPAIEVKDIKKYFRVPHDRRTSLKQHAVSVFKRLDYEEFRAIKSVNFSVKKGEFFGIIGQNGSGKSTLLKILAGIYLPTSGSIHIDGRLSPFIELGVGFNHELTASENIYLNGAILGLTRAEIDEQFDEIVRFAELEEFIDQKLKNYSSGMLVRLAFSVAIRAKADVLLIDEVLAVGDANFQAKCYDVFRNLKRQGKTIVFISHDLESINEFCDRVLLLNKGTDYGIFSPTAALAKYAELNQDTLNDEPNSLPQKSDNGSAPVKPKDPNRPAVESAKVLGPKGTSTVAVKSGDDISLQLTISNPKAKPHDVGLSIIRGDGVYCFGTNTHMDKIETTPNKTTYELRLPKLNLQQGTYTVVAGVFSPGLKQTYDMRDDVCKFQVVTKGDFGGLTKLKHDWRV